MGTETTFQHTFKNVDDVKIEIFKNGSPEPGATLDNSNRENKDHFAKGQNYQIKISSINKNILPNFYIQCSSFFEQAIEFDLKSLGPYQDKDTSFYFISPRGKQEYNIEMHYPAETPNDPPKTNVTVGDDEPPPVI